MNNLPADLQPTSEVVTVFGPASLSNLGPGYDTLGLCIGTLGDEVDAWLVDQPGVYLVRDASGASIPLEPTLNTASVAATAVLERYGQEVESARRGSRSERSHTGDAPGLALQIRKGIPIGSGIGGSAASAVAGALAASILLDAEGKKVRLIEAVLIGEEIVSGSRHGDNALPALFGGLVLVSPEDPTRYRRIPMPGGLHIAVLLPDIPVLTKTARDMLPAEVPRKDATATAAALAFMIDAFRCGDWETVGRCIMMDRLVEPVRAGLLPCYEVVRHAALDAGAFGCALTGSGPAMFALAETGEDAETVLEAMENACRTAGLSKKGFVTMVNDSGAQRVDCEEQNK